MKTNRLSDQEIEIYKSRAMQAYEERGMYSKNIEKSIVLSQFVIIELLERLLEQNKKEYT